MKKYLLMLCCAAVCAGFAGCSDDDDEGGDVSVESLTGRWSCYLYEEWHGGELVLVDGTLGERVLYILEFNADSTGGDFEGDQSQLEDEDNWHRFTYTFKGSQLSMRYDFGDVDECRVAKLTSSELVLAHEGVHDGVDEGVKYTEKLYFHRMK